MKVALIIAPNWRDYAKKYLPDCIKSLRKQNYKGQIKIFIADNETSDESFLYLKKTVPEAEIVRNKNNDGFAKSNNDCIKKAMKEGFEYIILFNMDTVVDEDCVSMMVKAAKDNSKAGSVQARLMVHGEKDVINSLGNSTHFLGFGYCLDYRKNYIENYIENYIDIMYPSGAAVLFKKEALKKTGLFDEDFWMYNEDQELGWRLLLAGYKNILADRAVVWHKYEFARSCKQYYWMDRNRILAILFCYRLPTLILIMPAFVLMEVGLMLFSIKSGWLKEKIRVWKYFLSFKNWKYIIKRRGENQKLRKVKDKDIIDLISGKIWYQEVDDWKLRSINPFFDIYWKLVRFLIIW
ncbi:glycosyltransferase [Candidatus Falkowbacteria bacterium]|nr:glycosyltransferase [Candidatus Falkowbacteria bacterium]